MKKKILIVLSVVLLIVLILGIMYLIDMKRMKDNKPVIFSTWGYDYAPPVSTYSSSPTILKNNYSKTIDNITIELNIPNDWHYEELSRNEENDFYKFALKLYKSDNSKHTILYYYHNKFGVCGTGRTDKKIYLNNGVEADIGFYDNNREWSDISFYNLNPNIALINYGLEREEAEEVLDFVKTIRIINNEPSIKESNRKAENVKLEIKKDTLTNTGATVIITDKNQNQYGWGEPYFIEVDEGGIWSRLKYLSNFSWIEIAYVLDDNDQYEQKINWKELYGQLPPGNYRLGKSVYDDAYVNFYIEFTIE